MHCRTFPEQVELDSPHLSHKTTLAPLNEHLANFACHGQFQPSLERAQRTAAMEKMRPGVFLAEGEENLRASFLSFLCCNFNINLAASQATRKIYYWRFTISAKATKGLLSTSLFPCDVKILPRLIGIGISAIGDHRFTRKVRNYVELDRAAIYSFQRSSWLRGVS